MRDFPGGSDGKDVYIYIYIYTHTHTHAYTYIYNAFLPISSIIRKDDFNSDHLVEWEENPPQSAYSKQQTWIDIPLMLLKKIK